MEEQLQGLKKSLSKEELADFVFTDKMKTDILSKIEAREAKKSTVFQLNKVVPMSLTAAAVCILSVGVHYIATNDLNPSYTPTPNPGRSTDNGYTYDPSSPKQSFAKPELIQPGYIPQGYVFKHTQAGGDLYKHVFVKGNNEEETFSYGMQETSFGDADKAVMELKITDEITGHLYDNDKDNLFFGWKDEGMYQFVEQSGSMKESDFYKIVDSILQQKGHTSLLSPYIEGLENKEMEEQKKLEEQLELEKQQAEAAKKAEEDQKAKLAFDEAKAIALLDRYEVTMNNAFRDSHELPNFKFKTYKTKQEFYALFTDFMSPALAEVLFGPRMEEREDGLYNLPTESPPNYYPNTPYTFEKVSEIEYKLSQFIEEEGLHYHETILITFKNKSGKWIIESISAR